MRWEGLFADLEAQLGAAADAEQRAEVADRTRRDLATVTLFARLRASVGSALRVETGAGEVTGTLHEIAPSWLLLAEARGVSTLVSMAGVLSLRGVARTSAPPQSGAADRVHQRLGLAHALRAIARDRAPVRIGLGSDIWRSGTIDRVGADWLDLAEHPPGEAPRRDTLTALRALPIASLIVVRSC